MAKIKSFPNNQDEYIGAQYVMKWLHGRSSGVFAGEDNASVTALATPAMAVQVTDGTGWMTNGEGDGVAWWIDTKSTSGSNQRLTIDAADGALNRIDRVIVEWKTTTYADLPEVKILKGKAASSPTAPALTNNATIRQISLAQIYVGAGVTEIVGKNVTDERLNSSVCGLVTAGTGVDTSAMEQQFRGFLEGIQRELSDLENGNLDQFYRLKFANVNVAPAYFIDEGVYDEYPYRASVALSGVTANMIPDVVFSVAALAENDFAPVAECYNGGVYIYAADKPAETISLATVVCWR